jgi:hypothetical protein
MLRACETILNIYMDDLNELKRLAGLKVPEKLDELMDFSDDTDDESNDVQVSAVTTNNQTEKGNLFKQEVNKRSINPAGDVKFTSYTSADNGVTKPDETFTQSMHRNLGPNAI